MSSTTRAERGRPVRRVLGAALPGLLLTAGMSFAAPPVPISPGHRQQPLETQGQCPTFSWGGVDGAETYEIAVYAYDEHQDEPRVLFSQILHGSALSWTPSTDRCLAYGETYAWTVRARGPAGLTEWAEPALFRIARMPSAAEISAALEILEQASTRSSARSVAEGTRPVEPVRRSATTTTDLTLSLPTAAARLQVEGEVRTTSGAGTRLWGKGRRDAVVYGQAFFEASIPCSSGGHLYGLSKAIVDWGDAAQACPAGSWVCSLDEAQACNTRRPGGLVTHARDCDGSDLSFADSEHLGWVSGSVVNNMSAGLARREDGNSVAAPTCRDLPVWCCWEPPAD